MRPINSTVPTYIQFSFTEERIIELEVACNLSFCSPTNLVENLLLESWHKPHPRGGVLHLINGVVPGNLRSLRGVWRRVITKFSEILMQTYFWEHLNNLINKMRGIFCNVFASHFPNTPRNLGNFKY
jgi:hypothetical protein